MLRAKGGPMGHRHVRDVALALALFAAPSLAGAQPLATPPAAPPAVNGLPPPVLGLEAPLRRGAIPPGYVVHEAPRLGLVVGGVATFLGTYIPMALIAANEGNEYWPLAVPVVGPFIVGGRILVEAGRSTCVSGCVFDGLARSILGFAGILVLADGIAQAGGIAMTVIGFVKPRRVLRYEPAQAGVRWAMTPGAVGAPLGLTLSLTTM